MHRRTATTSTPIPAKAPAGAAAMRRVTNYLVNDFGGGPRPWKFAWVINFQKNLDRVTRVVQLAEEKRCTPAQLALAWVLAQGSDVVPIFGTKRRKYLRENLAALDVFLSANDLWRIEEVAPKGAAAVGRYPEAMMGLVGR
jgi:aryl-alcohol dehydrogenase-like predicted oxidoreductase